MAASFFVRATWATRSGRMAHHSETIAAPDLSAAMEAVRKRIEARRSYAGKLTVEGFAGTPTAA